MLYRMRVYRAVSENLPIFDQFFLDHLLPVQKRYGARQVGRWQTEDHRVVAGWEYDSRADYERIQRAVEADPDTVAGRQLPADLPRYFEDREEVFMHSTLQR